MRILNAHLPSCTVHGQGVWAVIPFPALKVACSFVPPQHYETSGNLEEAERYFLKCDMALEAVEMYSRAGRWEAAQKVARGYLSDKEMRGFYLRKVRPGCKSCILSHACMSTLALLQWIWCNIIVACLSMQKR